MTQSFTNIYSYLTELQVLKLYLKYIHENSVDKSCTTCNTQPWTWPPTRRHEYTCVMNVELEIIILNLYQIDARFHEFLRVQGTNGRSLSQAQRMIYSLLHFNVCSRLSVTRQFNRLRNLKGFWPCIVVNM